MRALVGDHWLDGFFDYYRREGEVRIAVRRWRVLEHLDDVYFVRARSLAMVVNYLREVGPVDVVRKVLSRSREGNRNQKVVACGSGVVVEGDEGGVFTTGSEVAFIAPCHPPCIERLSLPVELVTPMPDAPATTGGSTALRWLDVTDAAGAPRRWWKPVRGWAADAEIDIDETTRQQLAATLREVVATTDWSTGRELALADSSTVLDHGSSQVMAAAPSGVDLVVARAARPFSGVPAKRQRKRGTLFGYGNFAKTMILPNVRAQIDVKRVHEIDPTQIFLGETDVEHWDTAPMPREDDPFDVALVAGFHHTHTPVTIAALQRGADAIVEKPIVVDEAQLEALLGAMKGSGGRLFCGFHKRYSALTRMAREDLGDGPISYHAIVYEVPLPELHWYRWPSSRSRLISNGCHWIDHFLHLNGYAEMTYAAADEHAGVINCTATLANGAVFTLALTDYGSPRVGVRDYVELRAHDRPFTAQIVDNQRYQVEDTKRVFRRANVSRLASLKTMYHEISEAVASGAPGDTPQTLERSSRLILALEDALQARRSAR